MDQELRFQLLRALIKDRLFLKENSRDVEPNIFPEREEQLVARVALSFYEKYHDPIGGMIRSDTETVAGREHYSPESRKKLKALLDHILGGQMELVSVQALADRVYALKKYRFYNSAVEEVLELESSGKLDASSFEKIVAKAQQELHANKIIATDFKKDVGKRVEKREYNSESKFPLILIHAIDERIRVIGRGHTGLVLAPFSSGKGMFLVHLDIAYAAQGWNVLHITLEDPLEEVENRLDACFTGMAMSKLGKLPNRFKHRFASRVKALAGNIKVVDGTGGGEWTIARLERVWRDLAQEGFVADVLVVDYDDYLTASRQFKGDSAKRFEMDCIYKDLTGLAAKLNIMVWTAAQGTRASEGKRVVTGKDAAEDISKIRKVFFALGIGTDSTNEKIKYLYVCRHRLDRSRFGVEIVADFNSAIFYDVEASLAHYKELERRKGAS